MRRLGAGVLRRDGPDAAGGTYANFISEREGTASLAYGENSDRLVEVKNEWDPTNLFRVNQNVEPTVEGE